MIFSENRCTLFRIMHQSFDLSPPFVVQLARVLGFFRSKKQPGSD
jgi:hypothetical protein